MAVEIPIDEAGPHISQVTELEGTSYVFVFRWNEREQRWYLDLRDTDGASIVVGQKIVANWPILRLVVDEGRRPPGEIIVQDTSGRGRDPRLGDLGTRVRLIYLTEAEVAALEASA